MAPRLRELVAPALLSAMALVQIALASRADLCPWLGGGFGMFATTDNRDRRHLHLVEHRPGLDIELPLPRSLWEAEERVRALPSEARLRALGRAVIDAAELRGPATLSLEIWRTRFDPRTLAPSSQVLRRVDLEIPSP